MVASLEEKAVKTKRILNGKIKCLQTIKHSPYRKFYRFLILF